MLNRRATQGFTLIEVMVTVFVVAIGLLTAAGLQALSKKAAFDALQRTTASVLAQDMLERLRANAVQVARYADTNLVAAPTTTVDCSGASVCTAEQLVSYDLQEWWESLDGAAEKIVAGSSTTENAGGLRSPGGCIRYRNGNLVEVVIVWRGLSQIRQATPSESVADPDDPTGDPCGEGQSPDPYEKDGLQSYRRVLRLQGHLQS